MSALTPANLLAWAIQAAVVVAVAAPLPRLLGVWSPRARLIYWRSVLLACLLLPAVQPWATGLATPTSAPEPEATTVVVGTGGSTVAGEAATVAGGRRLAPGGASAGPTVTPAGVTKVLVGGVCLRLLWLGLGLLTVGRLRRAARRLWPRPASIDAAASLAETDAEFLVSPTSSRPVTCGLLWPVVLVPRNFETFPEGEQTAIACHELLHVSRGDWVRNAADELVRAVTWFHPAIWWLINQIQLAREQVVDREAVRLLGARQPYLNALLRIASPAPRLILSPASGFLRRAHLRERVTLLVKEVSMSRARLVASFVIMAFVVCLGGRLVTAALPLQQSGAATPGVQTAPPSLDGTEPLTFKFGPDTPLPQVLDFIARAAGLSIAYEGNLQSMLSASVVEGQATGVTVEQALRMVLRSNGLSYRVTGPRAIVVTRGGGAVADGVPGGVAGGVQGGTSGGVPGGVAGGVGQGVQNSSGIIGSTRRALNRVDPAPAGQTGAVVMKITVDPGGFVTDVEVVSEASGLDAAAVDAARQWTFDQAPAPWTTYLGFSFAGQVPDGIVPQLVGGDVKPPRKLADVKPVYPVDAARAGIQGIQIVEATIERSGGVVDAWALRGHEALIGPAIAAVLQWRYEPALLNGEPCPVRMTVTVNFTLADGGSQPSGTFGGVFGQGGAAVPPTAAAPPTPATWPADAIRVGGNIKPPMKLVDVKPVYPASAQSARVQGMVICEVLIGPDGKVADARILRSIPLLDQAALDAVRQWEFTPTLLNGNPVPVIMTVTVNFTLQ